MSNEKNIYLKIKCYYNDKQEQHTFHKTIRIKREIVEIQSDESMFELLSKKIHKNVHTYEIL